MPLSAILFTFFLFAILVCFSVVVLSFRQLYQMAWGACETTELLSDYGLPCACTHEALISGGRKRAYTSWFQLAVVLGTTGSRRSVSISPWTEYSFWICNNIHSVVNGFNNYSWFIHYWSGIQNFMTKLICWINIVVVFRCHPLKKGL